MDFPPQPPFAGLPPDRTLTFFGPIRTPATNALRAALMGMVNEGAKSVTIYFASDGGSTDDGIALYTYLRALDLELTMHAMGNVGSIAVPVFLAADRRLASANAHFFFHEYSWTHTQPTVVTQTTVAEHTVILDRAMKWTKKLVLDRTKLTAEDFDAKRIFDAPVLMEVAEAKKYGLIQKVEEPIIAQSQQPRIVVW